MGEEKVQKFYPTVDELSSICSKVICPQENCKAVFQSSSNLKMHLIKHHNVGGNALTAKNKESQYFCPVLGCPYHKDSKKHFAKLKYVKQHYLKVHALKIFGCKKCGKKFSTESFRNLHAKSCGKSFSCFCGANYTSSEAVLTHCKRKGKGHALKKPEEIKKNTSKSIGNAKRPERFIYPKLSPDMSFPIHYIAAVALSELSTPFNLSKVIDKGIQTEPIEGISKDLKFEKKRKYSQQTQTSVKYKKLKISTQTQTIDYLKHKTKAAPKTILKKRKKSMQTQTKGDDSERVKFPKKSTSCKKEEKKSEKWLWDNQFFPQKEISSKTVSTKNELFNIGSELCLSDRELDLNLYSNMSKSNSNQFESEQGSDNQIFDRLCNIETQTEIDAFLTECNEDTNFTLCSTTETQTTDDFDSLLYSNMCTQTCEEVDQLFNFNFVHIETQTAWPDLNDCSDFES